MEEKISKSKVSRLAPCSYRIQRKGIATKRTKIRGFIIEDLDEVLTMPFKEGPKSDRKSYQIRSTADGKTGKLTLSPSRQKIRIAISVDRCKDSEERFREILEELIKGYEVEVLAFEIEEHEKELQQCLESEK